MPVPQSVSTLPVCEALDPLGAALAETGCAVLRAPPGAGKTTVVPLSLLDAEWLGGQSILMLEPRRLAARHAALRLAQLLGESIGQTVGLRIRHERIESDATRILVVTEGVLTRMLQHDAELTGVGAVLFDEFHERSLHADTALALCLQAREVLRPDLRLLVMSATLDTGPVAAILDDAPVIVSRGRQFPVDTHYLPDNHPVVELRDVAAFVARKITELVAAESGSLLVFLPGAAEIRKTAELLAQSLGDVEQISVCPLYGELDAKSQAAAVHPPAPGQRKIVLATNIAETSLTIEGVRVVIDSGLMRENRFHPGSGMNRLQTVFVSIDSADQRRGRAGRTEAGVCYRLWTRTRHQRLDPQRRAEILHSDLSQLMLELACWGVQDPSELSWLDRPPQAAVARANAGLMQLSALDDTGRISSHGRQMAALGIEPRLAHMVISGAQFGSLESACQLAAVLSEADFLPRSAGADLQLRIDALASARNARAARVRTLGKQLRERARRLQQVSDRSVQPPDTGALLGFAYPDRIAIARKGRGDFLLANGRGAQLPEEDALAHQPFLVVADLDDAARNARIYRATGIEEDDIRQHFAHLINREEQLSWNQDRQRVEAQATESLGAIQLAAQRLNDPDPHQVNAALIDGIRQTGFDCLPWREQTLGLLARVNFLQRVKGDADYPDAQRYLRDLDLPDLTRDWLIDNLEQWLQPILTGQSTLAALRTLKLHAAIESLIDWQTRQALDSLTPDSVVVASGTTVPIDYQAQPWPILAVRVQEVFGMQTTPAVIDGSFALTMQLLSPAHRPVQLTRDLAGFWRSSYTQVRSELRGRYPKHYWPEDPLTAQATSGTKKQMASASRQR